MSSRTDRACRPIATYGGNGVTNRTSDAKWHSVAYSGDLVPYLLPGETITKNPIKVDLIAGEQPLHPASRINFSKTYTIENNTKVKDLGILPEVSLAWAKSYWREYMDS
jgi:hypothetical protein